MLSYMHRKIFTPCLQEPEGLDTGSFFGDQAPVDESTLPDATSEESLALQPDSHDASGAEDPPDASGEPPAPGKDVPLGALQEERTKRQQAQDRARELEQQNTTLLERMNKFLMEQQQAAQPPQQEQQQEQIPDFVDDPVGHLEAKERLWQQRFEQLANQLQGNTQYQQQQAQHTQLVQQVVVQENEFRSKTPDYDAAVDHFRAMKANEYAVLGLNQVQIQQQLAKDSTGLAQVALQRNQNPAEVLYSMAKALGFKGGQPTPTGEQPPAVPAKTPPTSLSNLPATGRAPDETGRVTAKSIATMSNDEFDKFFESMKEGSVQRPAF